MSPHPIALPLTFRSIQAFSASKPPRRTGWTDAMGTVKARANTSLTCTLITRHQGGSQHSDWT